MKTTIVLSVLVLSMTLPAAAPNVPASPANNIAWEDHVTRTPSGFLVGNPAAKARVVAYMSLTCPACSGFGKEAASPLRARIATGDVSYEFRPFAVHGGVDLYAHGLMLCAGPGNFTAFSGDFLADQERLMAPIVKWWNANPKLDSAKLPAAERIQLAKNWGLLDFAGRHGLSRAKAAACLSDDAAWAAQIAATQKADKDGVIGVPTIFLNDRKLEEHDWPAIDRAIGAALTA